MSIETNIKTVNDKLQLLVKRYVAIKKDNQNLSEQLRDLEEKKQQHDSTVQKLQEKINILQMSAGQVNDSNHKEFEKRINDYIKEIDKCIGLLVKMPEQLTPINILIGDRTYRIKSLPKDEELIRKTVKTINDKIIEFKTQFAGKDMQDYIAMVLIWYATQTASENNSSNDQDLINALAKIEQQLDKGYYNG